jgi:hypothetical protein
MEKKKKLMQLGDIEVGGGAWESVFKQKSCRFNDKHRL